MRSTVMGLSADSIRAARACGLVVIPRLSLIESEVLSDSFAAYEHRLRRAAYSYYRSRAEDPFDATDWLVSEVYTYIIQCVIRGKRSIPETARQWLAVGKTIKSRYWSAQALIIDNSPVRYLADDDANISTRLTADRLQLDDTAFRSLLVDYARRGLGRKTAPDWAAETVRHWINAPGLTYRERAEELGLSHETIKDREAKTKAAIRAGVIGDLVAIDD